jgi:hypothetical protein
MSAPVPHRLAEALRRTAARLRGGAPYQWGHFGACNCGHLAQTLTRRSMADIHRAAVARARDWGHAAVEHCPLSGLPLDDILGEMFAAGLGMDDVRHLEQLDDRRILRRLPLDQRQLRRNDREHVARYMDAWAELLVDNFEDRVRLVAQ